MSNFRPTDRETGFLMPPSVNDWLPEHHLARFIVEVVETLNLRAISGGYRGSGSASYHPTVLLGILVVVLPRLRVWFTLGAAAPDPIVDEWEFAREACRTQLFGVKWAIRRRLLQAPGCCTEIEADPQLVQHDIVTSLSAVMPRPVSTPFS